jgi:predicted nucleic acid-binding protein
MIAVIDVCGAMEILLQKEKSGKFGKILKESTLVLTPDLYISELTNTLWKYYNAKMLPKDECFQFIQDGINFVDSFIHSKDIWQESFSESVNNNHSVYDMLYMVSTRRNSAILISNDSVLAAICIKNHVQVCY